MATLTTDLPDPATLGPSAVDDTIRSVDAAITQLADYRHRLHVMRDAPDRVERVAVDFLAARDGQPPTPGSGGDWPPYRQPLGAHDAYPKGYVIRWTDGTLRRATTAHVAHTPDDAPHLWEDVTEELAGQTPPPTPDANEWQPGETVGVGDLRTFEGVVYRCVQAHTTQAGWEPPVVPALWVAAA